MDWVTLMKQYGMDLVIIIAIIITYICQRERNKTLSGEVKSLKGMLEAQKTVVDTIKIHVEIYEKALKGTVQLRDEQLENLKKKQEEMVKDYGEKMSNMKEGMSHFIREYSTMIKFSISLLSRLPRETRIRMIEDMEESFTKSFFLGDIEYFKQPMNPMDFFADLLRGTAWEKEQGRKPDDGPNHTVLKDDSEKEEIKKKRGNSQ